MKKTILIGGSTGLVGSRLIKRIPKDKYHIKVLTRSPQPDMDSVSYHTWNLKEMSIEEGIMDDVDYVVNLTGAGIADKRWTDERKKVLIDSRVKSTELLYCAIQDSYNSPDAFISASAIGYFGDRGDKKLYEDSPPGEGFLAECCIAWENAVKKRSHLVKREVRLRIGTILTNEGGALPKMLMTKDIGLYNYFGDGSQYYAWIHLDDMVEIIYEAITNDEMSGVYNAVAPQSMTNKKFTKALKKGIGSFGLVLPAPTFALRWMLGEMADVVLNSTRVIPSRLDAMNFAYKYPDLIEAIEDLHQGG